MNQRIVKAAIKIPTRPIIIIFPPGFSNPSFVLGQIFFVKKFFTPVFQFTKSKDIISLMLSILFGLVFNKDKFIIIYKT